MLYTV